MSSARHRRRVLVLEDDPATRHLIERTLSRSGVDSVPCATIQAAVRELEQQDVDGVILDVLLPDGSGLELIGRARAVKPDMPLIVVSRVSEFAKKIEALRLGADAYVEKPVDWDALSRKVELLLDAPDDAARILIVEDDPISAMAMRGVLEAARHRVIVCSDPTQFESMMVQSRPDLVLLDVAMPRVSGLELARFLHQDSRFEATPVIYVTGTSDPVVSSALFKAGDPVLAKPVRADVLRAAVSANLAHSRTLRDRMERDSLTGLLGRAAFIDHVRAASGLALRESEPSRTLAILDLDRFKLINDRYGHPAGDSVLRETANVLRSALRAADVVGRIGGEEFGVLLATGSEAEAVHLMERVLERVRNIRHDVAGESVTLTFSAGLAVEGADADEWIGRADQALYRAKERGRNRVVSYSAATDSPPPVVFDPTTVAGLRELSRRANHNLVRELVDLFTGLAPERIRVITEAAGRRDAADVASSAHSLRGAAGNLGVVGLHKLCTELEHAADRQEWQEIERLAARLPEIYAEIGPALESLRDDGGALTPHSPRHETVERRP